ncbi:MAG TPA: uroporphyrinogen decarboxylase, partial [Nitrospirae bacterium]|nr:uroporphyrinogen decarboxylase [Nitrospirota bacterium]
EALGSFDVPLIYFVNNCGGLLELVRTSGADVIGIDWRVDMGRAITRLGKDLPVQGNLDPLALFSEPELLRRKVEDIIRKGRRARGHIFNLGHGILPQTPPEMAKTLVEMVHEISMR